jgi:hypothetical protein
VLKDYFTDVTRVSHQIVAAANDDRRRLFRLFPETQRLVQRAGDQLSENIRPAVAVWFFPSD